MIPQVSDFPEQIREALTRGEEAVLFTVVCDVSPEGINVTTSSGEPGDSLSENGNALLTALQDAGRKPVSLHLRGWATANIERVHARIGTPTMPVFKVTITGKADADGTITTTEALTVAEKVHGIIQVRRAGELTLKAARGILQEKRV